MPPGQLIRSLHTSVAALLRYRRANPGITYQTRVIPEIQEPLAEDPEGFGELESDFMEVHKTHRQYEQELQQQRERIKQHMIKHKYFREEKMPNLLLYVEKEQMRLLHARDPEEWTVERLAESFPATRDIVSKVLQAKWKPYTTKRIRKHDEAVIRNWELLRSGSDEIQLTPELREHLKKFASRKPQDIQIPAEQWPIRPEIPRPKKQEFLSLITSCSKYAEKDKQEAETKTLTSGAAPVKTSPLNPHAAEKETYLLSQVEDRRRMRLQEAKLLILKDWALQDDKSAESKPSRKSLEQQAVECFGSPSGTGVVSTSGKELAHEPPVVSSSTLPEALDFARKFESSEIAISPEDQRKFDISRVKDRIHIPRKLKRKGATYRVEDCYYDEDGEFLYRVPGMTGPK